MSYPSKSYPSYPRRRSRLLSLTACCAAATLLHDHPSSVDAFSLAPNAAAAPTQQSDGSGGPGPSGGAASAPAPSGGGRGAASAASAANPFRGSLNDRRERRRARRRSPSLPSSDDFARRAGGRPGDDAGPGRDRRGAPAPPPATPPATQPVDEDRRVRDRRRFLHGMLAATAAAGTSAAAPEASEAYERAYPLELQSIPYGDAETSSNSLSKLKEERLSNKKAKVAATKSEFFSDPLGLNQSPRSRDFGLTVAGASTWALALWLAAGSRSNPLVTPLANALYDEEQEGWLADRNEGYFADLPLGLAAVLSAVFVFLGEVLDRAAYFSADGDAGASLQLAGVSAIGGAVWEVGRLAAGGKPPTREESERDAALRGEFDEFASRRMLVGRGSCHRSDVVSAFRRYNPKYRDSKSERYPLADIEIERVLRDWNRRRGSGSEMSSAGFFAGIAVDGAADAFAPR